MSNKKKSANRYLILLALLIPLLGLTGFSGYKAYSSLKRTVNPEPENTTPDTSEEMIDTYYLRSNATDYQIELHEELEELLRAEEKDEIAIASSVVKNYIADFYTWSNKRGKQDIGGMYFVNSAQRINIYFGAKDYFYKYVSYYIEKYGAENLLEVEDIEIVNPVYAGSYQLDGQYYDSWYMWANWKYKENDVFNEEDYSTFEIFMVANIDGRYEIVEAYVE